MFPKSFRKSGSALLRGALFTAIALGAGLGTLKPAHALAPAGSTINNQAVGVYTDGSGIPQNVTSNAVQTVVQPVAFLSLTADNNKNATAGSTVTFTHTITNTGNNNDVFNLSVADLAGDDFNILPSLRADANGDGIADNILPITKTPSLAPGESFQFVVTGIVLSAGANGNTSQVRVTATSQFDGSATAINTDSVSITSNAQITVVKSVDKNSGAPGTGPYTYTLTYTNAGNTAANNLTITDLLPLGMSYVPNSGRWSNSGATALGDGAAGDPAGMSYNFGLTGRTVTANINSVPAGATGKLTFQVELDNGILPGILPNTAFFTYNDGVSIINLNPTNTVNLTVAQLAAFSLAGDVKTSANQGGTVLFDNLLTNTGSGADAFNIATGLNNFPLGTTFQLLQSDGVTPMLDSNGDGIPDTGSVPKNGTYHVFVKATLPPLSVGAGPYNLALTGGSTTSPLVIHTATDTLNGITGSTVDLTNDAAGTLGGGQGPAPSPTLTPITTLVGAAGTIQTFSLYIKNTSAIADSYVLLASTDGVFNGLTLPAGVTLTFKSDAGSILTNTGIVQPGDVVKVNASVLLPSGILPQTVRLYFRAQSLITGAVDTKLDAVEVAGLRSIAINPSGVGQVYPGNAVVYTHTLTNTGNLPEGDGLLSTIALSTQNSVNGFTSVVYLDANNDGVLDATDPVVTNLNAAGIILPKASRTLFVKVYAAAGTDIGALNATTLTATTTGGVGTVPVITVKDTTTVIAGQIRMEKTQALDNGGALVYTVSRITTGATPGKAIRYRIVATNVGTAPATGFTITDATPPFTVYDKGDGTLSATGNAAWFDGTAFHAADTPLVDGAKGTLSFTIGTLNPGQSATVTFGVKIQ